MKQLTAIKLENDNAERVRREHHDAITEIQKKPAVNSLTISDVQLANGVTTPISHGLGKAPTHVTPSAPRGATAAGYIVEIRDGTVDRTKQIALQANSYGATITVDVKVE
jgi:hypothetical protein